MLLAWGELQQLWFISPWEAAFRRELHAQTVAGTPAAAHTFCSPVIPLQGAPFKHCRARWNFQPAAAGASECWPSISRASFGCEEHVWVMLRESSLLSKLCRGRGRPEAEGAGCSGKCSPVYWCCLVGSPGGCRVWEWVRELGCPVSAKGSAGHRQLLLPCPSSALVFQVKHKRGCIYVCAHLVKDKESHRSTNWRGFIPCCHLKTCLLNFMGFARN